jgi:acetylornithine deacetylase/succinyl-diaminopimelate desuccinylase-like protein
VLKLPICRLLVVAALVGSTSFPASAQDRQLLTEVRKYRQTNERKILREFVELLSIPNVASDLPNIERNAALIEAMLKQRGVKTQLLRAGQGPPAVLGELMQPGAKRTVVFYAHYDGQPVNAAEWTGNPWKPVLRTGTLQSGGKEVSLDTQPLNPEWRLYARSASDDKAPIIAFMTALDALRAAGVSSSVNLKFFFEGEEEAGSPNLAAFLQKYGTLLKADLWLLCDGPRHQTGAMQIFFGARGVMGLEMTVYGPNRMLHSGHYGNWAPNPAVELAHLLADLRDTEGRVNAPGFYESVRPLTASEQAALQQVPPVEDQLKQSLDLGRTEGGGKPLAAQILQPAMNVRGLSAGHVGRQATNAIPTEATASIDFRLVPDQTPELVRNKIEKRITDLGYHIVHETPDGETRRKYPRVVKLEWEAGYPAARTSMDSAMSRALVAVIEEAIGGRVVRAPSVGGSVPMYLFADMLKAEVLLVPIANYDNNQHAANENLRLQNLWDGVEIYANLFARLGQLIP